MAINTIGIVLKWGTAPGNVAKVVDIKDYPDLGGTPDMLETTTLSDTASTFILGLLSQGGLEFTCNYTKADYNAVKDDANTALYYSLEIGTAGADGIFTWQGQHDVIVVGKGVNEVAEMKITLAPSSAIVISA